MHPRNFARIPWFRQPSMCMKQEGHPYHLKGGGTMLLVLCDIHMQKNASTCYMHMQKIANTCMFNTFQLLCVSSSRGSALQQHPFPLWPIFLQGRQCLVPQHSLKTQDIFTLVGARVVKL